MKFLKRATLTLLLLALVLFLGRGWVYRQLVWYEAAGPRPIYRATNKVLIRTIEARLSEHPAAEVKDVVQLAQDITARQLMYRATRTANDPNQLVASRRAHCVGYAAFCATTCNYLFVRRHQDKVWQARPQLGRLYFLGENVNRYFSSPFFRDHDFVLIENRQTGERLAVDPTISDYLGIDEVALRELK